MLRQHESSECAQMTLGKRAKDPGRLWHFNCPGQNIEINFTSIGLSNLVINKFPEWSGGNENQMQCTDETRGF